MDLDEANFRVVVRARDDDALRRAVQAIQGLMMGGGHSSTTTPSADGTLPEVDTWGIYAKADSAQQAQELAEEAVKDLEDVAVIVSVDPFPPSA